MPIALAWDVQHMQDPGSCINAGVFMRVQGAVNVFTDVVLLLYPLPLLPLLKFNRGQHSEYPQMTPPTQTLTLTQLLSLSSSPSAWSPSQPARSGSVKSPCPAQPSAPKCRGKKPTPAGLSPVCSSLYHPSNTPQDLGLDSRMVSNRSGHWNPHRVPPLPQPAAAPRLDRSQPAAEPERPLAQHAAPA
jgi:hypothetical protein